MAAGLRPDPLGELIALSQTPTGFKGQGYGLPGRELEKGDWVRKAVGREMGGGEGEEGKGERGEEKGKGGEGKGEGG